METGGVREIQLTRGLVALDHAPENCGEPGNRPNLKAWCQRCHLTYDAKHHAANAAVTRRRARGIIDLFEAAPAT
jgi:hypothetical protein